MSLSEDTGPYFPRRRPSASNARLKGGGRHRGYGCSALATERCSHPTKLPRFSWRDWHRPCSAPECAASASQNRPAQRLPMTNSYLLETLRGTIAVNKLQIVTLIESLSRSVELLTVHIEHEEERAEVRDLEDPTYPVLARSLRVEGRTSGLPSLLWRRWSKGHPRRPKWGEGVDRGASRNSGAEHVLEICSAPKVKMVLNGMPL